MESGEERGYGGEEAIDRIAPTLSRLALPSHISPRVSTVTYCSSLRPPSLFSPLITLPCVTTISITRLGSSLPSLSPHLQFPISFVLFSLFYSPSNPLVLVWLGIARVAGGGG
jgi:hypothetical protein